MIIIDLSTSTNIYCDDTSQYVAVIRSIVMTLVYI